MKIALDAMGGDHAPRVNIKGAVEAYKKWQYPIVLVGNKDQILRELARHKIKTGVFEVVHARVTLRCSQRSATQDVTRLITTSRVEPS